MDSVAVRFFVFAAGWLQRWIRARMELNDRVCIRVGERDDRVDGWRERGAGAGGTDGFLTTDFRFRWRNGNGIGRMRGVTGSLVKVVRRRLIVEIWKDFNEDFLGDSKIDIYEKKRNGKKRVITYD